MSVRKIPGARIEKRGWLFPKWCVHFSKAGHFELTNRQYKTALRSAVALIGIDGGRAMWRTPSGFFWADPDLSAEEVDLLVWDRGRRHDAKLARLRKIRARDEEVAGARRRVIPGDVRAFVWQRDDGRCVRCGADEDLQFDHIIPVAKGGGNAIENIQILCGDCNRRKSDAIA